MQRLLISSVVASLAIVGLSGLTGCASDGDETMSTAEVQAQTAAMVTGVGEEFGNVYLDVAADEYDEMGYVAGGQLTVTKDGDTVTMPLADSYDAVSSGEPVAVLHENGLTLAVRDGNFAETHDLKAGDEVMVVVMKP